MAVGVNAAVKTMEPTALHPVRNPACAHAARDQLVPRDHPPLSPRKLPQAGLGVFRCHFAMESAQPGKFTAWIASFTAVVTQALHKRG